MVVFGLFFPQPTSHNQLLGDCSAGVPPVPIPNTEVKPCSPDGTARASGWESRTSPELKRSPGIARCSGLLNCGTLPHLASTDLPHVQIDQSNGFRRWKSAPDHALRPRMIYH